MLLLPAEPSFLLSCLGSSLVVVGWLWLLLNATSFESADKQSKYLAYYHGGYGIGATISPLIATSIVNSGSAGIFLFDLIGFNGNHSNQFIFLLPKCR